jgi:hypothetical protein
MSSTAITIARSILCSSTPQSEIRPLFAQLAKILRTTSEAHQLVSLNPRSLNPPEDSRRVSSAYEALRNVGESEPLISHLQTIQSSKPPLSKDNAAYGETPPDTICTLLSRLARHNRKEDFSGHFVDAGSGNGGVTVCAALSGRFPHCRGVEYDEARSEQAFRLKAAYDARLLPERGTPIEFVCGDAKDESFNDTSVVFCNSVVWDLELSGAISTKLDEASVQPNALVVSITRQFALPSFDLVDILKLPCNGGDDFNFYICQKIPEPSDMNTNLGWSNALSDSETMRGLRLEGQLENLVGISLQKGVEGLAFLTALAGSEPSTRLLSQTPAFLDAIAHGLRMDETLPMRASTSMILRAMSDFPTGRRAIAESSVLVEAILTSLCTTRIDGNDHPAIRANLLDVLGEGLNDPIGNDKLESRHIDALVKEVREDALDQQLGEVLEACGQIQAMRRLWAGESRHLDL